MTVLLRNSKSLMTCAQYHRSLALFLEILKEAEHLAVLEQGGKNGSNGTLLGDSLIDTYSLGLRPERSLIQMLL